MVEKILTELTVKKGRNRLRILSCPGVARRDFVVWSRVCCVDVHKKMFLKIAKHLQGIFGLRKRQVATYFHQQPHPLLHPFSFQSQPALHFLRSLQSCFFSFIFTVFFIPPCPLSTCILHLHTPHPLPKLLEAPSNFFFLKLHQLLHVCSCCWLHFCCIYTHSASLKSWGELMHMSKGTQIKLKCS